MLIPLSDEIRIRGTAECWQLEKAVKRKGEREWQAFKYFNSLSSAVGEACGREIRLHPASGLIEAIKAVDEIAASYNKLLDDEVAEVGPRIAA